MRLVLAGLAICLTVLGFGCLWDSDTVAMELKGMPQLQDIVAGRFERNPDLYYEMRLARIEGLNDRSIEECFDAAVACDRLGRQDEAIDWIGQADGEAAKVKLTEEGFRDFSYKRSANLGTFYIHRGLKKGEAGLEDLKKGLRLVEESIEINPEAHFGREKVQAALVRHMIWQKEQDANIAELKKAGDTDALFDAEYKRPPPTGLTPEEIREGIIGLMVLGNAWEAPVAWNWLWGSLDQGQSSLRMLVELRIKEKQPDGMVRSRLPEPLRESPVFTPQKERAKRVYRELRENGDKWAHHREQFMVEQLKAGKHPDTDKDFWDGYEEVPSVVVRDRFSDRVAVWSAMPGSQILLVAGGAMALVIGVFAWKRVRSAGRA